MCQKAGIGLFDDDYISAKALFEIFLQMKFKLEGIFFLVYFDFPIFILTKFIKK